MKNTSQQQLKSTWKSIWVSPLHSPYLRRGCLRLRCIPILPLDLGRMLVIDYNEFDENKFKNSTDDYLTSLTRDNVQLLVNDIWQVCKHFCWKMGQDSYHT
jgi:Ribosome biogenesis regulatory protein (RRS1)